MREVTMDCIKTATRSGNPIDKPATPVRSGTPVNRFPEYVTVKYAGIHNTQDTTTGEMFGGAKETLTNTKRIDGFRTIHLSRA